MTAPYENAVICSACGGACCKHLPGAAFPGDFGLPDETALRETIASGQWAIDWWEGDVRPGGDLGRTCFVRPAVDGVHPLFDPSWGGFCTFLGPGGCILAAGDRPAGCRYLEPIEGGHCNSHGHSKEDAAIAWLPYQDLLESFG